jgi:hypothetical protein
MVMCRGRSCIMLKLLENGREWGNDSLGLPQPYGCSADSMQIKREITPVEGNRA